MTVILIDGVGHRRTYELHRDDMTSVLVPFYRPVSLACSSENMLQPMFDHVVEFRRSGEFDVEATSRGLRIAPVYRQVIGQ